ncbi:putative quinol monooxygenase [Methanosphaera sp.]|uniref:putative quinol monooxygenase n=1 Tax=Methanosphaera sp. TaxID=2666342 RepID=UPI0025FE953D|nr:putative quinol monooxygenase [Methanosphaera sp.]MEE1117204.1 putative quinol monooxygenase [Methanosphaera sp.]MEE3417921.1 putative quinol monooxygenase [Methanosphaera sp.]
MIIVHATLTPKEGKLDEIVEKAQDLLKESREHKGNISYNLYKNVEENTLLFVEKWKCQKGLDKHMEKEVFIKFGESIKDLLASELDIQLYSSEKIIVKK